MISERELDDRSLGRGYMGVRDVQCPIPSGDDVAGQGHRDEWNARCESIPGARQNDGVLEPEECSRAETLPEPGVDLQFSHHLYHTITK